MASEAAARFAPTHKWDRNFFLLLVVLIWIGIVMGFGSDIVHHVETHEPPFPLIVHVHAIAFVGWLVLLTTQVLLIRRRRHDIHRKLGIVGAVLAAIMIVLGPATAIFMQRVHFGTPASDPPFLAIQLSDIVAFTGFVIAAIALRHHSSAHKRLILLATLYISDAGFARWLGGPLHGALGNGFWAFLPEFYLANDLLILSLGAYDLITRRRLHPAYVVGVCWVLANQVTADWLYHSAFWKPVALKLIGH